MSDSSQKAESDRSQMNYRRHRRLSKMEHNKNTLRRQSNKNKANSKVTRTYQGRQKKRMREKIPQKTKHRRPHMMAGSMIKIKWNFRSRNKVDCEKPISVKQPKISLQSMKISNCGMLNEENVPKERPTCSTTSEISNQDYGRLVWAKFPGIQHYPGYIVPHTYCGMPAPQHDMAWVFWGGDSRVSQVSLTYTFDFVENFKEIHRNSSRRDYKDGLYECLKECTKRAGLNESMRNPSLDQLLSWGLDEFPGASSYLHSFTPEDGWSIPHKVQRCLERIRRLQERPSSCSSVSFSDASTSSDSDVEERREWKPKMLVMRALREGQGNLEEVCIACSSTTCHVVTPHPMFEGGLCKSCWEDLEDRMLMAGKFEWHCCICGSPGELLLCDVPECDKEYCTGCVELLISRKAVQRILQTDPWCCFLCTSFSVDTHGLLRPRPEWKLRIEEMRNRVQDEAMTVADPHEEDSLDLQLWSPRPLRVLSLFDGISTGLLALDKLKLQVSAYFASEIDEDAINVAKCNFGDRIQHLGDVTTLSEKKLADLCPIDVLLGGSPCNDLSLVNPNRKGLYDANGTGQLFFHFFRVLKLIQAHNDGLHLFWLFENVAAMPQQYRTIINQFLERESILLDAKFFSPQSRPRRFWGNLPGMYRAIPKTSVLHKMTLGDCIVKECGRQAAVATVNCITTNPESLKQGKSTVWPIHTSQDHGDVPWVTEIEKIFGFPKHYTDVGYLGVRNRQALLGKAWSVPVIIHLLQPLTKYFLLTAADTIEKNKELCNQLPDNASSESQEETGFDDHEHGVLIEEPVLGGQKKPYVVDHGLNTQTEEEPLLGDPVSIIPETNTQFVMEDEEPLEMDFLGFEPMDHNMASESNDFLGFDLSDHNRASRNKEEDYFMENVHSTEGDPKFGSPVLHKPETLKESSGVEKPGTLQIPIAEDHTEVLGESSENKPQTLVEPVVEDLITSE